ncbi:efflux RND transporter periplasmic adaptor subunit [uncultured Rhodoblastus sp.]|uniref:HlyD family secretion protein n=1 Tax=uncultured Rhodoblastus sp. TaxID=543037 RepID=UPI0025F858D9|nr:efflux RND transporter periplasmic adaptor subunit [uncultured Rhodoblastus sp.]
MVETGNSRKPDTASAAPGVNPPSAPSVARAPAAILTIVIASIVGLSMWYLMRPQPILIQGEVDATRIDIAGRVNGRVGKLPVARGENVAKGQLLVEIDNPELMTKLRAATAALGVAKANLANIEAGVRPEQIAQKKAATDIANANLLLSDKTYKRVNELAAGGNAPLQRLDEASNALQVAQRSAEQAKLAHEEAVAGATAEQKAIARANVAQAEASIDTVQAQVDELVVRAPIAAQVYQVGAELGEFVSPGAPLLSLVDLNDVYIRFDLREDLVRGLKVGDEIAMQAPALSDRAFKAKVKTIAARGEYAGWRATRATGDFDLRTFEVRLSPTPAVPELRPGMSVYAEAPSRK